MLISALVALSFVSQARGDQVVIGGIAHAKVTIKALDAGVLSFVDSAGVASTARLDEIDLIVVDRGDLFTDFNQAERFLAGSDPERAIVRYRRVSGLLKGFWPDLVAVRLVLAHDRVGQLDRAVSNFVRVVRGKTTGPLAAARVMPTSFPKGRAALVDRAISHLDAALARRIDEDERALLELLRYDILKRYKRPAALAAARRASLLTIPEGVHPERVYAILLDALQDVLSDHVTRQAMAALDRAIAHSSDEFVPSFLLVRGWALLKQAKTSDDFIRAAWPFLRVAIHFADDGRAADGLYGAAVALERMGRVDKAMMLLRECLEHKPLPSTTRRLATAALDRLAKAGVGGK